MIMLAKAEHAALLVPATHEILAVLISHNRWPVVPIDQLDPKVPQAIDLLGINMVVWRDEAGSWHAMQDRCPHRWAHEHGTGHDEM